MVGSQAAGLETAVTAHPQPRSRECGMLMINSSSFYTMQDPQGLVLPMVGEGSEGVISPQSSQAYPYKCAAAGLPGRSRSQQSRS